MLFAPKIHHQRNRFQDIFYRQVYQSNLENLNLTLVSSQKELDFHLPKI